MKLFANIIPVLKAIIMTGPYKRNLKNIRAARQAGDFPKERQLIQSTTSSWAQSILDIMGAQVHVYGKENLPESGPVVFMGNHQGYADIFTYFAVLDKFQFGFVAKEELRLMPYFGKFIGETRSIFIERNNKRGSLNAISEGIDLIEDGFSLAIFPEGTRSRGGDPAPFMRGSIKLATKPGVPIVPISIEGTYKLLEAEGYFHGGDVYIKIHPPVQTAGIDKKAERTLMEEIESIVLDGLEEIKALSQ